VNLPEAGGQVRGDLLRQSLRSCLDCARSVSRTDGNRARHTTTVGADYCRIGVKEIQNRPNVCPNTARNVRFAPGSGLAAFVGPPPGGRNAGPHVPTSCRHRRKQIAPQEYSLRSAEDRKRSVRPRWRKTSQYLRRLLDAYATTVGVTCHGLGFEIALTYQE
jgi:hypothetical protein